MSTQKYVYMFKNINQIINIITFPNKTFQASYS
jgi:hypothetical protein